MAKNQDHNFVRCLNCKHATFMQWYENPVVAYCSVAKERLVANSKRVCKMFVESGVTHPQIEHHDDYREEQAKLQHLFYTGDL